MNNQLTSAFAAALITLTGTCLTTVVLGQDVQPLPEEVTAAWEKAGAEVQVYQDSGMPRFLWLRDTKSLKDQVQQLPDPGQPFEVAIVHADVTSDEIAGLAKMKSLASLDLSGSKVSDDGMQALGEMSLTRLTFFRNPVTDAHLGYLANIATLEELHLRFAKVTDDGLRSLAKLNRLQTLELAGNTGVTDAGVGSIADLSNLQTLNLSLTRVGDAGVARLVTLKKLETLNLGATRVTDVGAGRLANISSLKSLVLPSGVTDEGLAHLSALENLQSLKISLDTKVSGKTLAQFAKLEVLDLGLNPHVDDTVLQGIGQMVELRTLTLSHTKISDAGMAHLTGLTNLEYLRLDGTPLTDAGIKQMLGLKKLETIILDGTQVTDAGLDQLKKLPKLKGVATNSTKVTREKQREMYFFLRDRN